MITSFRSDKRKKPKQYTVRFMTYDEVKEHVRLYAHVNVIDRAGKIAEVKVTSVRTWARKPTIRVSWKFGLHEYGFEDIEPGKEQGFFIHKPEPVEQES